MQKSRLSLCHILKCQYSRQNHRRVRVQLLQFPDEDHIQFHQKIQAATLATVLYHTYRVIVINKAPAPREVLWDNLGFSYIRNLMF